MEISFNLLDPAEVEEVFRLLRNRHPLLCCRANSTQSVNNSLSVRTRSCLQQHCISTQEQLFAFTRQEALNLFGDSVVKELEDNHLNDWKRS